MSRQAQGEQRPWAIWQLEKHVSSKTCAWSTSHMELLPQSLTWPLAAGAPQVVLVA